MNARPRAPGPVKPTTLKHVISRYKKCSDCRMGLNTFGQVSMHRPVDGPHRCRVKQFGETFNMREEMRSMRALTLRSVL